MTYIPTFEERPVSRSAMLAQAICLTAREASLTVPEGFDIPNAIYEMAERRQPTEDDAERLNDAYKEIFGDYTEHPDYGKDH